MKTIAIDFETYYAKDYDVSSLGIWHYVHDPRFDAYLVSVVSDDIEFVGPPKEFDWSRIEGRQVVSHNASFDEAVWLRLVELGVVPDVRPASWDCTADLAVFVDAPRSLAEASKQLLGVRLDKTIRDAMKGVTWDQVVASGKAEELKAYALRDATTCHQLWERYSVQWPEKERRLSRMTRHAGRQGVRVDAALIDQGIAKVQQVLAESAKKLPWVAAGRSPLSVIAFSAQCREAGIKPPASLSEDDPQTELWEAKYSDPYPWVGAMRDYRKAMTLFRKLETMRRRIRPTDGCMGYGLKYFGSHTGRWSGDAGFNIQNLPKGEMYGVDLRACLIPRPGKKFIICDLSQIEPRVLAWLCYDHALLEKIRNGMPIYEAHARATMGWTGGNLKKEDPKLYGLAKARVLGLGYGCGREKFVAVAKAMGGLDLSLAESDRIVRSFRASNPRIVNLWTMLDRHFKSSVARGYAIDLPNHRCLNYYNVLREGDGYTAQTIKGGPRKRLYGGLLCENVVQATARDVFAEALIRLEDAGFNVVFHVHDEAIVECDETVSPKQIEAIVAGTPSWLSSCPLAAEAIEATRYTK